MRKIEIEPGTRFGLWTVIGEAKKPESRYSFYLCKCNCGTERAVRLDRLLSGKSASCGKCGVATTKQMLNIKPEKSNISGRKGVRWNKMNQRWEAYITVDGERKYLGQYLDKEDAIHAREQAENEVKLERREMIRRISNGD